MRRLILCFVGLYLPLFLFSQITESTSGIKWTNGLSWNQIKQKAKVENKFIFIDAYATWCQPCRVMDRVVYSNDTIGDFYNEKFLSVKVQMDRTDRDNEEIRGWYDDASKIQEQYKVIAFPTYVFLSPEGKIVYKSVGYQAVPDFLSTGKIAVRPGQVYTDKYESFDKLLADYKAGIRNYDSMSYMIETARELKRGELLKELKKDYMIYLAGLSKRELLTKDRIAYLSSGVLKSDNKLFSIFYKDGKRVDRIMGTKGYAGNVVGWVILKEISAPFLGIKGISKMLGGKMDTLEADWILLRNKIEEQYSGKYVERGMLDAKMLWYDQHYNLPRFYESLFERLDKYGFDLVNINSLTNLKNVNSYSWNIFQTSNDRSMLKRAAYYMEKVVEAEPRNHYHLDTYANLLYKLGDSRCIQWEEEALRWVHEKDVRQKDYYITTLSKMREGVPTWPTRKKN